MSEAPDRLRSYLEAAFPQYAMSEEWDRSRNVLVVKLKAASREEESGSETLLVELAGELIGGAGTELDALLAAKELAPLLRRHYRVLVSSRGLEPLPWRQLSPKASPVDEASWESFPASDPAPLSSLSRDADPEDSEPTR